MKKISSISTVLFVIFLSSCGSTDAYYDAVQQSQHVEQERRAAEQARDELTDELKHIEDEFLDQQFEDAANQLGDSITSSLENMADDDANFY